jgi:hypothetical protein
MNVITRKHLDQIISENKEEFVLRIGMVAQPVSKITEESYLCNDYMPSFFIRGNIEEIRSIAVQHVDKLLNAAINIQND